MGIVSPQLGAISLSNRRSYSGVGLRAIGISRLWFSPAPADVEQPESPTQSPRSGRQENGKVAFRSAKVALLSRSERRLSTPPRETRLRNSTTGNCTAAASVGLSLRCKTAQHACDGGLAKIHKLHRCGVKRPCPLYCWHVDRQTFPFRAVLRSGRVLRVVVDRAGLRRRLVLRTASPAEDYRCRRYAAPAAARERNVGRAGHRRPTGRIPMDARGQRHRRRPQSRAHRIAGTHRSAAIRQSDEALRVPGAQRRNARRAIAPLREYFYAWSPAGEDGRRSARQPPEDFARGQHAGEAGVARLAGRLRRGRFPSNSRCGASR